jgi:hypothetical protein
MWETEGGDELVLADLCARCAARGDRLLDVYGGRARASMRLAESDAADATVPSLVGRVSGVLIRGAVYVLIALAVFFVVTLLTARD